jgi:hypothetical protein
MVAVIATYQTWGQLPHKLKRGLPEGVLAGIVASWGNLVAARVRELERLSVGASEGVGEGVEGQVASEGERTWRGQSRASAQANQEESVPFTSRHHLHVKVRKSKSGVPALIFQQCLSKGVYQGSIQAVVFGDISRGDRAPWKTVDGRKSFISAKRAETLPSRRKP